MKWSVFRLGLREFCDILFHSSAKSFEGNQGQRIKGKEKIIKTNATGLTGPDTEKECTFKKK